MHKKRKQLLSCFLTATLTLCSFPAFAAPADGYMDKKQNKPEAMAVDIVMARPLGIAATVTGAAVFLVSLPFSAIGGNADEAWTKLVVAPAKHAFTRPLGEFED